MIPEAFSLPSLPFVIIFHWKLEENHSSFNYRISGFWSPSSRFCQSSKLTSFMPSQMKRTRFTPNAKCEASPKSPTKSGTCQLADAINSSTTRPRSWYLRCVPQVGGKSAVWDLLDFICACAERYSASRKGWVKNHHPMEKVCSGLFFLHGPCSYYGQPDFRCWNLRPAWWIPTTGGRTDCGGESRVLEG